MRAPPESFNPITGAPFFMASHDPITWELLPGHSKIRTTVLDEHADFLERVGVQQKMNAFPGAEFTFLVLGLDPLFPASLNRLGFFRIEMYKFIFHTLKWLVEFVKLASNVMDFLEKKLF